ncbi:MAG TPA: multicopper oxidase family protein [Rhizomicrobium sp.]|jgi:FtsP/CotA-like multicopper oxidase with cupredoxin domain
MRETLTRLFAALAACLFVALVPCAAMAAAECPRPAEGSTIMQPPDVYSQNGVLSVQLNYYTDVDKFGRTRFCYVTPDGLEGPTLHLNPGDTLKLDLKNMEPDAPLLSGVEQIAGKADACNDTTMQPTSVNLHFHGLNVTPRCHGDQVLRTIVNPGQTFRYHFRIPTNEPPGMYWYHAHVHGIAGVAVQGGASGAIEVEGIANLQPAVAGLPQRFLVFRDQPLAHPPTRQRAKLAPFWDVSLNYVPVSYPRYRPGVIKMQAGAQEFWRLVNASADTIMDVVLQYDGKAQPLQIVAFDGVPTGSHDGKHQGTIITQNDILIPPAGRAEFIVTGPSSSVREAYLMTRHIDTGPAGDVDTRRPLARIELTNDLKEVPKAILPIAGNVKGDRFDNLDDSMVTAHRSFYFDEHFAANKSAPGGANMFFYIERKDQKDHTYQSDDPPSVITHKGAVEDWTIENRTQEVHEFHIHQIHFQVIAVNGVPVAPKKRQFYDTYQVGYWDGVSKKFPSITLRMDFRGAVEGEFVYHCHILDHEDAGMMANIVVAPPLPPKRAASLPPLHQASAAAAKKGTRQTIHT